MPMLNHPAAATAATGATATLTALLAGAPDPVVGVLIALTGVAPRVMTWLVDPKTGGVRGVARMLWRGRDA